MMLHGFYPDIRSFMIFRNIFPYTIEFYERACELFLGCALAAAMLDEAGPKYLSNVRHVTTSCAVGLLVRKGSPMTLQ
jgi:hypothetical protein